MSAVEFDNKEAIDNLIKDVRDDGSAVTWLLLGYLEGKANTITTVGSGSGGVAELAEKLDEDKAMYGLIRVTDIIDGNATTKFVLIQWVGDKVKTLVKARTSTHLPPIKSLLKHHVFLSFSDKGEVSEQSIMDKVSDASGSSSRVLSEGKRNIVSASSTVANNRRKSFVPSSTELKFVNPDQIKNTLADLRPSTHSTDYVVLGYEGDSDDLTLVSSGSGGLSAVLEFLNPDVVLYSLLKVSDAVEGAKNTKFILITWVGEQVKIMRKARISTHQGAVQNLVGTVHAFLNASDKSEISETIIKEKLSDTPGKLRETTSPRATTTTTTSSTVSGSRPPIATTGSGGSFVRRLTDTNFQRKPSGTNLVPGTISALSYPDDKVVKDAITELRKGDTNWVLLGYEGATSIVLRGKGTGGVSEFVQNLVEDKVLYGLVKKEDEVDGHKHIKFAAVFWTGEKVSYVAKAKVGPHRGEMNQLLAPYHADITASTLAEITDEIILNKFRNNS